MRTSTAAIATIDGVLRRHHRRDRRAGILRNDGVGRILRLSGPRHRRRGRHRRRRLGRIRRGRRDRRQGTAVDRRRNGLSRRGTSTPFPATTNWRSPGRSGYLKTLAFVIRPYVANVADDFRTTDAVRIFSNATGLLIDGVPHVAGDPFRTPGRRNTSSTVLAANGYVRTIAFAILPSAAGVENGAVYEGSAVIAVNGTAVLGGIAVTGTFSVTEPGNYDLVLYFDGEPFRTVSFSVVSGARADPLVEGLSGRRSTLRGLRRRRPVFDFPQEVGSRNRRRYGIIEPVDAMLKFDLFVQTGYSFNGSLNQVDRFVERAKTDGFDGVGDRRRRQHVRRDQVLPAMRRFRHQAAPRNGVSGELRFGDGNPLFGVRPKRSGIPPPDRAGPRSSAPGRRPSPSTTSPKGPAGSSSSRPSIAARFPDSSSQATCPRRSSSGAASRLVFPKAISVST
ncbi:MAG: hypothetical protein MZU95_08130 [Desulfomicrobium escambiense]|nr:hypothetical protein [Desulfomicrobium escambiense]